MDDRPVARICRALRAYDRDMGRFGRTLVLAALACALAWPDRARADVAVEEPERAGGPVLRAELDLVTGPTEPPPPPLRNWTVRALVLVARDGKTLWRRAPPPSMAAVTAERKRVDSYRMRSRAPLEELGFPFVATDVRADSVVVIALESFVVFARSDGRVVHEETVPTIGFGSLPFAHADVTVQCGARRVSRRVANAPWLIDCGPRLVYYFVQGIAVFDTASWKRFGGTMFPDVTPAAPRYPFEFDGAAVTFARVD
jgi:hypothetical protein